MKPRILLIEDDLLVLRMLEPVLEIGGFDYETARSAESAMDRFGRQRFDAILLDLGLPDLNGAEVISALRRRSRIPILVLSGQAGEAVRVESLDLGADDFIAKPFLPGELLARIRAALRRERGLAPEAVDFDGIRFDAQEGVLYRDDDKIPLTGPEKELLSILAARPDTAVAKEKLCNAIWGSSDVNAANSLRVLVSRLRAKLEPDPDRPTYILSRRGIGYELSTRHRP